MEDIKAFRASDYATRESLETAISGFGYTTGYVIGGTIAELKTLHLSHGQSIHSVPVVALDYVLPQKKEKPSRGAVRPHGLDGQLRGEDGQLVKPADEIIKKETE